MMAHEHLVSQLVEIAQGLYNTSVNASRIELILQQQLALEGIEGIDVQNILEQVDLVINNKPCRLSVPRNDIMQQLMLQMQNTITQLVSRIN